MLQIFFFSRLSTGYLLVNLGFARSESIKNPPALPKRRYIELIGWEMGQDFGYWDHFFAVFVKFLDHGTFTVRMTPHRVVMMHFFLGLDCICPTLTAIVLLVRKVATRRMVLEEAPLVANAFKQC